MDNEARQCQARAPTYATEDQELGLHPLKRRPSAINHATTSTCRACKCIRATLVALLLLAALALVGLLILGVLAPCLLRDIKQRLALSSGTSCSDTHAPAQSQQPQRPRYLAEGLQLPVQGRLLWTCGNDEIWDGSGCVAVTVTERAAVATCEARFGKNSHTYISKGGTATRRMLLSACLRVVHARVSAARGAISRDYVVTGVPAHPLDTRETLAQRVAALASASLAGVHRSAFARVLGAAASLTPPAATKPAEVQRTFNVSAAMATRHAARVAEVRSNATASALVLAQVGGLCRLHSLTRGGRQLAVGPARPTTRLQCVDLAALGAQLDDMRAAFLRDDVRRARSRAMARQHSFYAANQRRVLARRRASTAGAAAAEIMLQCANGEMLLLEPAEGGGYRVAQGGDDLPDGSSGASGGTDVVDLPASGDGWAQFLAEELTPEQLQELCDDLQGGDSTPHDDSGTSPFSGEDGGGEDGGSAMQECMEDAVSGGGGGGVTPSLSDVLSATQEAGGAVARVCDDLGAPNPLMEGGGSASGSGSGQDTGSSTGSSSSSGSSSGSDDGKADEEQETGLNPFTSTATAMAILAGKKPPPFLHLSIVLEAAQGFADVGEIAQDHYNWQHGLGKYAPKPPPEEPYVQVKILTKEEYRKLTGQDQKEPGVDGDVLGDYCDEARLWVDMCRTNPEDQRCSDLATMMGCCQRGADPHVVMPLPDGGGQLGPTCAPSNTPGVLDMLQEACERQCQVATCVQDCRSRVTINAALSAYFNSDAARWERICLRATCDEVPRNGGGGEGSLPPPPPPPVHPFMLLPQERLQLQAMGQHLADVVRLEYSEQVASRRQAMDLGLVDEFPGSTGSREVEPDGSSRDY